MYKKRVVVTGIGCLTAIGCNKNDFWNSLIEGKSGAKTIDFLDTENITVKYSAYVKDFDTEKYFDRKDQKKMDIFMQYGMAAGIDAVNDSKLLDSEFDANRVGVSIGSGIGGLQGIEDAAIILRDKGPRRISPFFIPGRLINLASGHISIRNNFKGPNHSVVTACSTGSHAIGDASRLIAKTLSHKLSDILMNRES